MSVVTHTAVHIVRDQHGHIRFTHHRREAAAQAFRGKRGWVIETIPDALTTRAAGMLARPDPLL